MRYMLLPLRPRPGSSCRWLWLWLTVVGALAGAAGCDEPRKGKTYFEREIQPILVSSCAGNTSGCHATNPGDPFQVAAGNLDVTSFERLQKRRDLLVPFGPYETPPLLIKAVQSAELEIAYGDESRPLQVLHGGGPIFNVDSDAYRTLLSWLQSGASESGVPSASPPLTGDGPCSTALPPDFAAAEYLANPTFAEFRDQVQPLLTGCAAGACHGAPQSDFYVTCGSDDAQLAFNFRQAWSFVADPVDDSQLLRVPLAVAEGGGPHSGGDQLPGRDSTEFVTLRAWAEKVGRLDFAADDPGRLFFAEQVQPVLLQRGCAFQACHSPAAGNDFKLRSGSSGFFSAVALERNYELMKNEFMALEYADARRGRAVAKTVDPRRRGITHRAKAVLETPGRPGADPATCPDAYDPATATAFCTIQEWVDIERQQLIARGELRADGAAIPLVFVTRKATDVAGPLELDRYQPGSDLVLAEVTLGPGQAIASATVVGSLLGGCGVSAAVADVRSPDVRYDGDSVAFAMRGAASEPLGVYVVTISDRSCRRVTPAVADVAGIKIHDFDPAWSPDGDSIVFASTRGGPGGPTRSRKLFQPQSDLWRIPAAGGSVEQLTFLTNSEIQPQMMREGRIIMTTEKVSAGFYQLAGRRLNWDRTDYHPLLAQRAVSLYPSPDDLTGTLPSVDYQQATEIREASDGNFLLVLSDPGARGGAGTLAVFNRSVGPFEAGRADAGYVAAMHIVDRAATGRVGSATSGAYRSPSSLPDGQILASYAAFNGDLATATSLDWDLVAVDPASGSRTPIFAGGLADAQVEAVLAIQRPRGKTYANRRQLVFGGGVDGGLGDRAVVHFPDAPMAFTVLTGNLRRGRPIEAFRAARQLAVYEEAPAGAGTTSGNQPDGIFESRRLLGRGRLAGDGSIKVSVPAGRGIVLELQDGDGNPIVTMGEEHQLGPGERISLGVREELFDAICGGCHGSISGKETDVIVTPDALTGASQSASADSSPIDVGN